MTKYLLLTGAGFSRSWQAWLGFEVFAYLLGCEELSLETRDLLWRCESDGKGLEYALAEVQARGSPEELEALTAALVGMFRVWEKYLGANSSFNASDFVAQFDAVFTLNQDVLLETKCAAFLYVPGTRWNERTGYRNPEVPLPELDGNSPPGMTPYFKLHGSSDLFAPDAAEDHPMLIMGGGKVAAIQRHNILVAFAKEFERWMGLPNARMVISGYGFRDDHINDLIAAAVGDGNLRLFINDVRGSRPLEEAPPLSDGSALIDLLRPAIIGFSSRPIREAYGGDDLERQKYERFFSQ